MTYKADDIVRLKNGEIIQIISIGDSDCKVNVSYEKNGQLYLINEDKISHIVTSNELKIGSLWRCKVETGVTKLGGKNIVCLFINRKAKKNKYAKILDILYADVIKVDFDGLETECTFENLIKYFKEIKEVENDH